MVLSTNYLRTDNQVPETGEMSSLSLEGGRMQYGLSSLHMWCLMGMWLKMLPYNTNCWGLRIDRGRSHQDEQPQDPIYPGTLWCGPGNVASNPDELGRFNDTDACCRDHDMCPDVIGAGATKHGLTNNASYARVHCPCDDSFHSCLKSVGSVPSSQVGHIYFTLLDTACFRQDYPIVRCKTYSPTVKGRCEEYELDEKGDKQWQWFDVQVY